MEVKVQDRVTTSPFEAWSSAGVLTVMDKTKLGTKETVKYRSKTLFRVVFPRRSRLIVIGELSSDVGSKRVKKNTSTVW